jgi:hypothetical protein
MDKRKRIREGGKEGGGEGSGVNRRVCRLAKNDYWLLRHVPPSVHPTARTERFDSLCRNFVKFYNGGSTKKTIKKKSV